MERASASCYFLWRTALVTAVVVAGTLGVFLWQRAQHASLAPPPSIPWSCSKRSINSRFLIALRSLVESLLHAVPGISMRHFPVVP